MNASFSSLNLQPLLEKAGWNRMDRREQFMVGGLATGVVLLLIFQFIFSPLLHSKQKLQHSVVKKQIELQKIQELQQQYRNLANQSGDIKNRLSTRPKTFSLFSFIEQQANASGIKQNIEYLKPSEVEGEGPLKESRVDMKIEKINLAELVKFLQGAESTKNVVSVNRISIQEQGKDQGYVNAVIQLVTFHVREKGQ